MMKVRQYLERQGAVADQSAELLDAGFGKGAKTGVPGHPQMGNLLGVEPHKPATGSIHCNQIAAHDENSERLCLPVDGTVPFHR